MTDAVHIIAEAGTNHGGDPAVGRQLIDIAADGGADSVKFQVIYPEGLYLPATWQDGELVDNEVFAIRRAAMLDDAEWPGLAAHARQRGLGFSASVFDDRGLDLLDELDADYVKLASTDLNNHGLLRAAAARGRRVVLSTGLSSLAEVHDAVEVFTAAGGDDLVLLHCVSIYPAPVERANVGFVEVLRREFGLPVGFSDHTESSVAAVAAVALGATWLEKHITFDRGAEGFDHVYAAEPDTFAAYVADVRAASAALAGTDGKVSDDEASVRDRARRSVYAATDLDAGHVLGAEDLLVVRPPGPLDPGDVDGLLGRPLERPLRRYEALDWQAVGGEPTG